MRNSNMCLKVISEGENRENGKEEDILKLQSQVFKNCKMMMSSPIVKAHHVPRKINNVNFFLKNMQRNCIAFGKRKRGEI